MPYLGRFARHTDGMAIPDKQHRLHGRIAVLATFAIILLGGPTALLAAVVFAMASAACTGPSETAVICQTWGQLLVTFLAPAALLVGFVLCLRGIAVARRGGRPIPWTVSGWAVFVLALVVCWTIATAV